MNYSKELIKKAETATSPEELMSMASAEGISLSESTAKLYYKFLNNNGSLTEEELDIVAGGKGDPKPPAPKYHVGQRFEMYFSFTMNYAHGVIIGIDYTRYGAKSGYAYLTETEGVPMTWYLESDPNTRVYD